MSPLLVDRIVCREERDLPSADALMAKVERGRRMAVLEVPSGTDFRATVADGLPDDFSVFVSGSGITVMRVIPRRTVMEHADAIVAAARHFRRTAADLVSRLCVALDVPASAFWTGPTPAHASRPGQIDDEWTYGFHGQECLFRNTTTGQDLDVVRGYDGEPGVLDPWFFARYLRTTPELAPVSELFADEFHDPLRAITILEEAGRLRRIPRTIPPEDSGVTAGP